MKYFLLLVFIFSFSYSDENNVTINEYEYIEPISIEIAPIIKEKTKQEKVEEKAIEDKIATTDTDQDGIYDSADQCPDTPLNSIVNNFGCTKKIALNINFDTNQYSLKSYHLYQLQEFTFFLKKHKDYFAVIYGYADNRGDIHYNKILSKNRAKTVKKALVTYGISESRLTAIGMGIEDPVADNNTSEGRAKNRRIEVILIE